MQQSNCVIVGSGPVGLICGLLLSQQNIAVTFLYADDSNHDVGKVLALSYLSVQLLKDLDSWPELVATPIHQVHVSHAGFGIHKLDAQEINLPYLGYTIKYTDLCKHLKQILLTDKNISWQPCRVEQLQSQNNEITILYTPDNATTMHSMQAKLVIVADGGTIKVPNVAYEEHQYQQMALIAQIHTQYNQENIAYERFNDNSTSVLLPYRDDSVLVYSTTHLIGQNLVLHNNLIEYLQQLPYMKRFGKLSLIGQVNSFSLKLRVAQNRFLNNILLVGNSAYTVHPILAQGLNLAIRDVIVLNELITEYGLDNLNGQQFNNLRRHDSAFVVNFTHTLATFMDKKYMRFKILRSLGSIAFGNCPPLKQTIANKLIFGL